jgi:hypothetical protein
VLNIGDKAKVKVMGNDTLDCTIMAVFENGSKYRINYFPELRSAGGTWVTPYPQTAVVTEDQLVI